MTDLTLTTVRPGRIPVVMVDFAFTSAGMLTELLSPLPAEFGLIRVDPLTDLGNGAERRPLPQMAAEYAALIEASVGRPGVLTGHCGASGLALHIGQALHARALAAPVAIVDPAWITDWHCHDCLHDARIRMGVSVGPIPDQPFALAEALRILEADIAARFVADGVPADELADVVPALLARYDAWLGFLEATRDAGLPVPPEPTTLVVSADAPDRALPDWPASVSVHEVEPTRPDLRRSAAARALVTAAAAAAGVGPVR